MTIDRLGDEREPNTRKYDYGRLQIDAAVIGFCEKMGAVDLRPPMPRKPHTKLREPAGFGHREETPE